MKKMMTVFGMIGLVFLSGCSLLGEVNNSIEYANTTTDYMNTAKNFANEVPQLASDAVTDEAARQQLEEEITTMKEEIKKFNETEVPSIAEDIHNQIVSSNAKLEEGIDMYLTNIENGKVDPELLENSEIISTINELSSLMDQIEELGN
jgi:peptidoglycan hydrolase CwlO-like protein